jgi:heme A synthase
MANVAINVLWFLIGLIILAGVVWLAIWVIESFIYPIPERVKQGIWVIVLLLALIALIGAVVGGGHSPFRFGEGIPSGITSSLPAATT